jgi:acyl carrier protein
MTDQANPVLDAEPATAALAGQVAAVWQDVLRKEAAGPDDDFFDAGGNSMLLLAMLELVQRRLGVEIPPDDLSEGVTISRITQLVQRAAAQA